MPHNEPEPQIAVRILQTSEGPKFVTVYPMVEPEEEMWPQFVPPSTKLKPVAYDELSGLMDYVKTKLDQENN